MLASLAHPTLHLVQAGVGIALIECCVSYSANKSQLECISHAICCLVGK